MDKFCDTLDIRYISSLTKKDRDDICNTIADKKIVDIKKIPEDKLHIYYILLSYFNPDFLTKSELTGLSMNNFCNFFRSFKISTEKITTLFYTVYNQVVLSGLNPTLNNYSNKSLNTILNIVDRVYFNNILKKYLSDKKITLTLSFNNKYTSTAGLCTKKGCNYSIQIATNMFDKPFKQGMKSQKINGLKCYNQLECMLHVFTHELVHLIIFVFCIDQDVPGGHGVSFKQITQSLFGHTDFRHNLGIDAENIGVDKKDLYGRKYISYFDRRKNKKVISKIQKINIKTVSAIPLGETGLWKIPFAIIDKEEPKVDISKYKSPVKSVGITRQEALKRQYISWKNNKTGQFVVGKVKKVKITRVIAVTADNMGYDIPLDMIEKNISQSDIKHYEETTKLYEKIMKGVF